jgi:hypothetical protein
MNVLVPIAIAFVFLIIKVVEMKYVTKELKPIKFIIRDTLFVGVAAMGVILVHDHFQSPIQEFIEVVTNTKPSAPLSHPEVFTDMPGF